MNRNIDIGAMDRRARSAGYGDGLVEISAAVVLLAVALGWLAHPSFVGIVAAFIVLYGWKLVDRVRARVTYPRIGYHRERRDEPKATARGVLLFIGGALLLMVLVILIAGGLTDASEWRRAAPLMSGVSLAGGFSYAGTQSGLPRYRMIAGLSVVSGALLWWFGSGESYAGVIWHLVGLAVPLAVIGVWSLVRFVHAHPVSGIANDG